MPYALGIDLGTTYTAAALYRDGRAETLPLGDRAHTIPSVLFLREDGVLLVGEAAERRGLTDPARVARQFKRRLGDPVPVVLAGQPYEVADLTADLLRWVLDRAMEREAEPPAHVVLTHPASWGEHRQQVLTEAAAAAGLATVGLLPEPTAAAVHYATQERVPEGALVGVYDLGGGTFDACVVRKTADGFAFVGEPEGDAHLGGTDFDQLLFDHVLAALGDVSTRLDFRDPDVRTALAHLRAETVAAKEALSADISTTVPSLLPGFGQQVRLTRPELERLLRPALAQTVQTFTRTVRSAGVKPADLSRILLVGGSSRIPLVSRILAEELGVPVAVDAHPKYAVCLGAAVTAGARMTTAPMAPAMTEAVAPQTDPAPPGPDPWTLAVPLPRVEPAVELEVDLDVAGLTAPADVVVAPAIPIVGRTHRVTAIDDTVTVRTLDADPAQESASRVRAALVIAAAVVLVATAALITHVVR